MGLKRIEKPDGEVYFVNGKGERVPTGMDKPPGSIFQNLSDEELIEKVLLTTEAYPINLQIENRLNIVTAECSFGMNLFEDFFTAMSDIFGGRSKTTQDSLRKAREVVLRELRIEALRLGANAVIGVNLSYSEFSGKMKSMLFIVASGTAVILRKI
jgi:uncharacterized protein YbjQ (UPF0145 family)